MKKILITTILFLMLFSVPVLAGSHKSSGTCAVKGCNNSIGKSRSIYCTKHRCTWSGCTSLRMDGSYCAYDDYRDEYDDYDDAYDGFCDDDAWDDY